jgi:hypothetical protein
MFRCKHFQRIHGKVAKRLWSDLPIYTREVIASDVDHTTQAFQWFATKVMADATRLFEDADYFDNVEFSFRYPKSQQLQPLDGIA